MFEYTLQKLRTQFENQNIELSFYDLLFAILLSYAKIEAGSLYWWGDEWKITDVSLLSWQC